MELEQIAGKPISWWLARYPQLGPVMAGEPAFWVNPGLEPFTLAQQRIYLTRTDLLEAEKRLARFAPYIAHIFTETARSGGVIESPLAEIQSLHDTLQHELHTALPGKLLLKCDHQLPISGSIKARGGIYEVLHHAEELALSHGLISRTDDYTLFAAWRLKDFFSRFALAVGSTGNLGLSIGIMGAALGFRVIVHMSAGARQWKKDLLRGRGVEVVEYATDYSRAVARGREQAAGDPFTWFIDDEHSPDLFLGYAVAALRLEKQLAAMGRVVDRGHPLFVYLPCGVGGGPGGITFGLKQVFGDYVHCFFAEPVQSPCMLLGLMTGLHDRVSVQDFGLSNRTDADGLAVGRPSGFVGRALSPSISGIFTEPDSTLHALLGMTWTTEKIFLEPSALAALTGPFRLLSGTSGRQYLQQYELEGTMEQATHLVWATGGSMVPVDEQERYLRMAARYTL